MALAVSATLGVAFRCEGVLMRSPPASLRSTYLSSRFISVHSARAVRLSLYGYREWPSHPVRTAFVHLRGAERYLSRAFPVPVDPCSSLSAIDYCVSVQLNRPYYNEHRRNLCLQC
ncbi:hypothetical protein N657DRAFT_639073 [Parathielavia appendiculata]|uniref:Uncharacterized protein n=1 Tax=Parathielavia appendiculata TaxID=2587402 RepID=A0AAN6U8X9_9PEZI|nr:hypothetical protein N657DRAFT_639073 [Parathielavia appendiculata]